MQEHKLGLILPYLCESRQQRWIKSITFIAIILLILYFQAIIPEVVTKSEGRSDISTHAFPTFRHLVIFDREDKAYQWVLILGFFDWKPCVSLDTLWQ